MMGLGTYFPLTSHPLDPSILSLEEEDRGVGRVG